MNSLTFNTENARAWHEGRKTQHRELMKPQSSEKLCDVVDCKCPMSMVMRMKRKALKEWEEEL